MTDIPITPQPNPVYPTFGRILLQAVISNMLDYQGANQQPQDKPDRLGLTMAFAHPEFLVSTDWLAERLADDDVRVFETTIFLHPRDGGGRRIESGRRKYESGHIPGSGFLDLQADFSDNGQPWHFMMPSAGVFAEAAGRHGISESSKLVLYDRYDRLGSQWAARLWWMFRSMGCGGVAVLDGG